MGSDGKFRVRECTIVGEKDLKELGLARISARLKDRKRPADAPDSDLTPPNDAEEIK
jgi:hypothetical protein